MEANKVTTNIRQEAFDLEPEFQRELHLSDEINWTFAILFGQHLHLQVPIACDAAGVLEVDDHKLVSALDGYDLADYFDSGTCLTPLFASGDELGLAAYFDAGVAVPPLYSSIDAQGLVDYFDTSLLSPPLYDATGGASVADIMFEILQILIDVHDVAGHAIKTNEIP